MKNALLSPSTVIAVDDWGLSPAINEAMLLLAQKGVVKRISVLTDADFVDTHLAELLRIPNLQIGIHFNLTYRKEWKSPLHVLRDTSSLGAKIEREWARQWAAWKKYFGDRLPSHLDGHQHVHIIPRVWEVLGAQMLKESIRSTRVPYDPALWLSAKAALNIFALRFRNQLKEFHALPFAYPDSRHFRSKEDLKEYLDKKSGYEILFHPATKMDFEQYGIEDDLRDQRVRDYLLLLSLN